MARFLVTTIAVAAAGLLLIGRAAPRLDFVPHILAPHADSVAPVDVLRIQQDDFVIASGRQVILGRLLDGETVAVWQENFAVPVQVLPGLDVDGDGRDEVCVMLRDSRGVRAQILDRTGTLRASFGPVSGPPAQGRPWEGGLMPTAALRAGSAPAVVCILAGLWSGPRGILGYDLASGRVLWGFPMGSWPQAASAVDLRDDGCPEVLVTTASTLNGVEDNGTDDAHGYLIALNGEGRRLWQAQLCGGYGRVSALALPRRGARAARVVVAVHSHRGASPERCTLAVLDGANGARLAQRSFTHSLGQPRLLDSARDVFVVGGADHILRSFDATLELRARFDAGSEVEAWACVDLDGDGTNEVVASTGREVLVLDARLRMRGRFLHGGTSGRPIAVVPAHAGPRRWRLCTCDGRAVARDIVPVSPLRQPAPLAGVALAGLASGLGAAMLRRPQPGRGRCRADIVVHDALLASQRRLLASGVTTHFAADPGGAAPVLFDPDELRELTGQLLENAAAALRETPAAELRISVGRDHDADWIAVLIADNGPGIPAEMREAVFRPDYSSRAGGGFGLARARERVRRWRGDLTVEDNPRGRGVVMKLRLRVLFPADGEPAGADTRTGPRGTRDA